MAAARRAAIYNTFNLQPHLIRRSTLQSAQTLKIPAEIPYRRETVVLHGRAETDVLYGRPEGRFRRGYGARNFSFERNSAGKSAAWTRDEPE